jgi:hypothetical protein
MDTIWNISVLGNVLLSRGGLEASDRQSVLGNPSMQSSVVFSDVVNTADILNKLRKNADYVIDIGPEGGLRGGTVVAKGTPEDVAKNDKSYTGKYLKKHLK